MGHYFEEKAPMDIGTWCYENGGIGKDLKDYEYIVNGRDFLNQGAWRKFSQYDLRNEDSNTDAKVQEWGFYYVPTQCQTKESKCHLQLWLHGGGGNA